MDDGVEVEQLKKVFSLLATIIPTNGFNAASTNGCNFNQLFKEFDDLLEKYDLPLRSCVQEGLRLFENEIEKESGVFWNASVRIAACFGQLVDLYESLRVKFSASSKPDAEADILSNPEIISIRDNQLLKCACEMLIVFGISVHVDVPLSSLHLPKRIAYFGLLSHDLIAHRSICSQSSKLDRCLYLVSSLRLRSLINVATPNLAHAALLRNCRLDCIVLLFQLARWSALSRKQSAAKVATSDENLGSLADKFIDRFTPVCELVLLQSATSVNKDHGESTCSWLRTLCSYHLGRLVMRAGGLKSVTFAVLTECLGVESAEVWKTDARKFETVATLIGRSPPHVDSNSYFANISSQFANSADSTLLTPVYAHVIGALLHNEPRLAYSYFLNDLLAPLLRIQNADVELASDEQELVSELEFTSSVSRLHAVFVKHADPRTTSHSLECLRGVAHVLFTAFVRVRSGVSSLRGDLRDLLVHVLRHAESESSDVLFRFLIGVTAEDRADVDVILQALATSVLFNDSIGFENGDLGGLRVVLRRKSDSNEPSVELSNLVESISAVRLDAAALTGEAEAEECGARLDRRVAEIRDSLLDVVRTVNRTEKQFTVAAFFSLLGRWAGITSPIRRHVGNSRDVNETRLLSVVTATLEALVGEFEFELVKTERRLELLGFAADFLNAHYETLATLGRRLDDGVADQDLEDAFEQLAGHLHTTQLSLGVAFALMPDAESATERQFWLQLKHRLLPEVERLGQLLVDSNAIKMIGQTTCDLSRVCWSIRTAILTHSVVHDRPMSSHLPSMTPSDESDLAFAAIQRSGVLDPAFNFGDSRAVRLAFTTLINALETTSKSEVEVVSLGALVTELRRLLVRSQQSARAVITERRDLLLSLIGKTIGHHDTFVYLAAVELLAAVVDVDDSFESRSADTNAFRLLVSEFCRLVDDADPDRLPACLTLSEALQKASRKLGQLVTCYREQLAHAFLRGARHKDELLRSSALAGLAELCPLLGHDAASLSVELFAAADALSRDKYLEVRRAAVLLLAAVIRLPNLDATVLRDAYRCLRAASENDPDEMVRGHALVALKDVDHLACRLLLGDSFVDADPRKPTKRIFVLDPPQ